MGMEYVFSPEKGMLMKRADEVFESRNHPSSYHEDETAVQMEEMVVKDRAQRMEGQTIQVYFDDKGRR